jgi:hypothetical protein
VGGNLLLAWLCQFFFLRMYLAHSHEQNVVKMGHNLLENQIERKTKNQPTNCSQTPPFTSQLD